MLNRSFDHAIVKSPLFTGVDQQTVISITGSLAEESWSMGCPAHRGHRGTGRRSDRAPRPPGPLLSASHLNDFTPCAAASCYESRIPYVVLRMV